MATQAGADWLAERRNEPVTIDHGSLEPERGWGGATGIKPLQRNRCYGSPSESMLPRSWTRNPHNLVCAHVRRIGTRICNLAFGMPGIGKPIVCRASGRPRTVLTMLKDDQRACSSAWFAGAHFRSCTFAPSRRRCMAALRHSPPTQSFIPFATTQSQDARSPKWTADLELSHLVDNKHQQPCHNRWGSSHSCHFSKNMHHAPAAPSA